LSQQHARSMQLRLAATRRDAELFTDFFVRETFNVVQHEHLTRTTWKSCYRCIKIESFTNKCAATGSKFNRFVITNCAILSGVVRLLVREYYVHCHAVQPR
jgi:hypothetical protein